MRVAVLITGQLRDYKVNVLNQIKHLIEPNNADVFVYACNKNTLHTCGANITQRYNITTQREVQDLAQEIEAQYGDFLKGVKINDSEPLADDNYGTLGYFRQRMQNQMDNIRKGFLMAQEYSKQNNFTYDLIVRSRPDNSMYPKLINFDNIDIGENIVGSTQYYTGHRDPWFFAFARPDTFDKYCDFKYLPNADGTRTDNDFLCPEHAMEAYLPTIGIKLNYYLDICLTFTGYDKTQPVVDFPYRQEGEKLIDSSGNMVDQVI